MRSIDAITLLCGAIAAAPALGAEEASACAKAPNGEGMREMRHRKLSSGCRIEMMSSMMEAMIRHDLVMHEEH